MQLAGDYSEIRGEYTVLEKIGEGTFSEVYKAKSVVHPNTNVALKRIHPNSCPARIENEVKILSHLGGRSNVASILQCFRLRDRITLVLPFFPHKHFRDYYLTMSEKLYKNYFRALLEALDHLHNHGIIHRDVKPGNFLSDGHSRFLLVDYGLAQNDASSDPEDPKFVALKDMKLELDYRTHKTTKSSSSQKRASQQLLQSCSEARGKPDSSSVANRKRRRVRSGRNHASSAGVGVDVEAVTANSSWASWATRKRTRAQRAGSCEAQEIEEVTATNADVVASSVACSDNDENTNILNDSNVIDGDADGDADGDEDADELGSECQSNFKTPTTPKRQKKITHVRRSPRLAKKNLRMATPVIMPISMPLLQTNAKARNDDSKKRLEQRIISEMEAQVCQAGQDSSTSTHRYPVASASSAVSRFTDNSYRSVYPFQKRPLVPKNSLLGRFAVAKWAATHTKNIAAIAIAAAAATKTKQRTSRKSKASSKGKSNGNLKEIGGAKTKTATTKKKSMAHRTIAPAAAAATNMSAIPAKRKAPTRQRGRQKNANPKPRAPTRATVPVLVRRPARREGKAGYRPKLPSAPRSGTRGFRAPEVLLRIQDQTSAIDVWSVGVIMLCILSKHYPFFHAPDDLNALAEITRFFGVDEVEKVAREHGRRVELHNVKWKDQSPYLSYLKPKLEEDEEGWKSKAFELLKVCLDPSSATRATARQALMHSFFA